MNCGPEGMAGDCFPYAEFFFFGDKDFIEKIRHGLGAISASMGPRSDNRGYV
jgi:hypothetical protein